MRHSLALFLLIAAGGGLAAANPIVRDLYTADPAARVFGDRIYVYTSHDEKDATYFDMFDWRLFSTADLVTWQDHGSVFHLKDFAWAKQYAWAPEAIAAHGKYYLFLPTDRTKIGVAVADAPTGPFKDAIGAPLIDFATMPEAGREPIDPAVFTDDDGSTWLYFGCRQPMVVKLDSSLTKLAGPLQGVVILDPSGQPVPRALPDKQPALPMGYGEAPTVFKRGGKYYYVYSNGWAKESTLVYAIGDSPAGPFTYQGEVMKHVACVTHHGSLVEFRGKWYIFYHTSELSGGNTFRRAVCVDELTFAPDGKIIPVTATSAGPAPAARVLAPGPFQPNWESLAANYRAPDWFRDAKFGIWAHWSAQCVPEDGDWYARQMYIQGHKNYRHHAANYGHPADTGFMEIENRWKAENWQPEKLMDLYVRAGAKYFVALANHHDNFDAYNSKYHAWNSVNVGPKQDIVGTWARVARARGLRFGVSNHSAHAWHWYQTAYGYDAEGPRAGERYDAFRLRKADGKGKWWEGLDPQDLYTGPNIVIPDGFKTIKEANEWHEKHDRKWDEKPPAANPRFTDTWFLRAQDLVDQYRPDLVYFDNFALPLGQAGLDIAAHYYNASLQWHDGRPEAVLNIKGVSPERRGAVIDDIERGVAEGIRPAPWQTDTCIGAWHYDRAVYDRDRYKTVAQVVRMLADIVSKNGNLLLSVPVRGDGTIDEKEAAFLEGLAKWMDVNSDAIFGTRPWVAYGEGPSVEEKPEAGHFGGARDVRSKPYTAADLRFTTKGGALYAIIMELPAAGQPVVVKSLGTHSTQAKGRVTSVTLLGHTGPLQWSQDETGLKVTLPAAPSEHAIALKITGVL